jgi:Fur family transcriptional regulator, peroxide stress response regulator
MIPNMKSRLQPQDIEAKLKKSLREKGYKLTPQRKAILNLLAMEMSHPGAADILKKVKKTVPQISMSTVYYTLDMLKKEGLIQELEFYDRDNRYDINVSNHINLICKKCGKIEDFPGELPYSYNQVQQKTDFQPVAMRYEYYGYCKDCRRKRAD